MVCWKKAAGNQKDCFRYSEKVTKYTVRRKWKMKQLSNLTKVMFCIVAVLLVITVGLGIATAIKDGKSDKQKETPTTTVTPSISPTAGAATGQPGEQGEQGKQENPALTPTAEPTATPTPTPASTGGHKVAIDPGQQKKAGSEKEPIGPGATEQTAKMTYGATSLTTSKREYEWNMLFSEKLRTELEARGYEVYLTRETNDVSISNGERATAASESGAEIYISIQADGVENESANGIYTQIPSKANKFVGYLYKESHSLAEKLQNSLIAATKANNRGLVETDAVAAINYSKIPVAILQLGFMSNRAEDTKLWTEDYQNTMVKAICDGIDEYFKGLE